MNSKSPITDVQTLDEWYQRRCDGLWEHRYGVKIETCDNPGWLMTFTDLALPAGRLGNLLEELPHQHGADVRREGATVRIFARSLERCLTAARELVKLSRSES